MLLVQKINFHLIKAGESSLTAYEVDRIRRGVDEAFYKIVEDPTEENLKKLPITLIRAGLQELLQLRDTPWDETAFVKAIRSVE